MKTLTQHTVPHRLDHTMIKTPSWRQFIQWSDRQKKNQLGWMAFSMAGHGCVFTPLTAAMVLLTGNLFIFWPFIITAMGASLVVNLTAQPTRVTIPVLFLSLVIDAVIIGICLFYGFDTGAMYR